MTVRGLAEEILGLDLGAALAAASLAVRLGFARKKKKGGAGGKGKEEGRGAPPFSADDADDNSETRPLSPPSHPSSSSSSQSSIALVVDAAVTSSLMAGALSPGLKTHAVSLFEGGRIGGSRAVSDLLRELDSTTEAAERFGAEGGIAELAADATALAVVVRALQASGGGGERRRGEEEEGELLSGEGGSAGEGGGGGGKKEQTSPSSSSSPHPPRVELLRREALEGSLPRGAAARLLRSQYDAVVSVAPAAPLAIRDRSRYSLLPLPPLFLGPCPDSTSSPLFSHLLLWHLCGRGPPAAVALPAGLSLRRLPRGLEGAPAAALWCWRGGAGAGAGAAAGGGGGSASAAAGGPELLSPRPGAAPRAPPSCGLSLSQASSSEEEALLGAGVARAPFLLRCLDDALASRRSLGGGVIAVPLPFADAAAAGGSLDSSSGLCSSFDASVSLSSSAASAEPAELSSRRLSFADVALPLAEASLCLSPAPLLEAVDPWTGEKINLKAPERWGEAARGMALSSCVGVVRFCRFPHSGNAGEKEAENSSASPSSSSPSSSSESEEWFPLGIRLGVPLSPRPTCDAVCAALARSDLLSPAGIGRARSGQERRAEALARFLGVERGGGGGGGCLSVLPRALAFDGKEMKPAAAAASGSSSASGGKGAATAAVLGRRCLQAPGAVFEV